MPDLVLIQYRTDTSKEWFYADREKWSEYFTQNEIDTILQPFYDGFRGLSGYMGTTDEFTDTKFTVKHTFNNDANLEKAVIYMLDEENNPLLQARHDLMKRKREELGVEYGYEMKINW